MTFIFFFWSIFIVSFYSDFISSHDRPGSEQGKEETLDGENMDNCFNSIQVCRFWKCGVNKRKMGHFGRIWTLKLHGHFFETRNLITCEFDADVKKALEDAWVPKTISFQIKLRPYITWYSCLNQQNLKILKLHSLVLLESISHKFLQKMDMIIL